MTGHPQRNFGKIIWGILCLFWLPFEDQSVLLPVLFGLSFSGLYLFRGNSFTQSRGVLRGALLGGIAVMVALTLMLVKGGLHSHGFSDFPVDDFLVLLAWLPIASLAGALAGLALNAKLGPQSANRAKGTR